MTAYNVDLHVLGEDRTLFGGPITWPTVLPIPRTGEILYLGDEGRIFDVTEVSYTFNGDGSSVNIECCPELDIFNEQDITNLIRESGLWKGKH
jgi:hypothetical protein